MIKSRIVIPFAKEGSNASIAFVGHEHSLLIHEIDKTDVRSGECISNKDKRTTFTGKQVELNFESSDSMRLLLQQLAKMFVQMKAKENGITLSPKTEVFLHIGTREEK